MTEEEALQFFPTNLQTDLPSCKTLIQELGGFPILLSQAVRYIQERHLTVLEYLQNLKQLSPLWKRDQGMRYSKVFGTTFQLSLAKLQEEDPLAHHFLQCAAYWSPNQIDKALISFWLEKQQKSPHLKGDIIFNLEKFSLAQFRGDKLLIQRPLQTVIAKLQEEKASGYFAEAISTLEEGVKGFNVQQMANWKNFEVFFMNSLALIELPEWAATFDQGGKLSLQLGRWLKTVKGMPKKALPYIEMSVPRLIAQYGAVSSETALGMRIWGEGIQTLGQHQEALEKFQTAYRISQEMFGENHIETAKSSIKIGCCLNCLNHYQEALEVLEPAYQILQVELGENNTDVASVLDKIGDSLRGLGRPKEALVKHKAAHQIFQAVLGKDHSTISVTLGSISRDFRALGDLQQELEYLEAAYRIDYAALGENHRETARSLKNIGTCLHSLGRYREAEEKLTASHRILQMTVGEGYFLLPKILKEIDVVKHLAFQTAKNF